MEKKLIPAGYKPTEVGVVPEEWDVATIKNAFAIHNNLRLPLSSKVREGIQGKYPYYGPTKIQDYLNEYRVEGKYALIGEDGDHFLKFEVMPQTQLAIGKFNVNNHAHLIQGERNLTEWFYFYFRSRDVSASLTRQGAGRYKLSKGSLEVLPCALPPISEQKEIVDVLSDVDALIAALEKLINKKSAIKTAVMQQLLTGKKRLPQFDQPNTGYKQTELGEIPGDWAVVALRDAANFINGRAYGIHEWETHGIPVIRLQNLTGRGEDYYFSNLVLPEKQYCQNGDLLYMWSATFGPVIWFGEKAIFHYHIWKVETLIKTNKEFLYFTLDDMTDKLKRGSSSGGTMLHVTKAKMESTKILYPTFEEQTAIANVLSDMDKDLAALQQRLHKTQQIKQGMMQELLTGKTRLVK